jgi:hypothetical protein
MKKSTINFEALGITGKEKEMLKKLYSKKNGAFFRIAYITDCNSKVSAPWKGHNVSKITTMSVRKGISYDNVKTIIEKRALLQGTHPSVYKASWFHHIDKTLLKHNTKDSYYVALFPNHGKKNTRWLLDGIEVTKEYLINNGVMQPSFWASKSEPLVMFTLGLDKIIDVY